MLPFCLDLQAAQSSWLDLNFSILSQTEVFFIFLGFPSFPFKTLFQGSRINLISSDCFLSKEQGVTDEAHEHHV